MSEKYKQVKVNFYPEQHLLLKAKAKENNQTIAQYIRQNLDLNIDEKEVKKRYRNKEEKELTKKDEMLVYQVMKIGNNLNQIAKYINTKKDNANSLNILESLVNIEKEIKNLL